ncbi:MAG TPA: hypothetical protein VFY17_02770 [Pilimelia sp.]|nr:hypothetical protein [Pilimelia sp.]
MTRAGGALRAALAGLTALLCGALAAPAPARAHSDEAPGGSDVRVRVTALTPAVAGVTVTAVEAGVRLQLTNRSGRTVEVRGDAGEPFLRVGPGGVFENAASPTTHRNRTLAGAPVPADADAAAPPRWRRVADGRTARWHDSRARWPEGVPAGGPARPWSLPLTVDGAPVALTGTVQALTPPAGPAWWLAALVGTGLVALLGLVGAPGTTGAPHWYGRAAATALGLLAVAGGLTALWYAVARERDAGAAGPGGLLAALATAQVWPVLTAAGAVGAGVYALRRPAAADFALALSGACLGLFPGVANAAVFGRAVPPAACSGTVARVAVAVVVAVGLGLAAAGTLRLRTAIAAARQAPAAAAAAGPTD